MRAAQSLDGLVRKEAQRLVRQAKDLLESRKRRTPRHDELRVAADEVGAALGRGDLLAVRRGLPALDGAVDELTEPVGKSVLREYTESISIAIVIALVLRAFVIEAFKIPSSSMYPTLEINDHIFVSKFIYGVRVPMSSRKILQVRAPKRGEVAVFLWPCNHDKDYIKRIVALAGDTVEVRCNTLYVNGAAVNSQIVNPHESYIGEYGRTEPVVRYRETLGGIAYDLYQNDTLSYPGEFPSLDGREAATPTCIGQSDVDPNRPPQVPGVVQRSTTDPSVGRCAPQLHYVVPPGHVFGMGDNRGNSNDSRKWGAIPIENLKGKAMFIWLSYDQGQSVRGIRWSRMGDLVH